MQYGNNWGILILSCGQRISFKRALLFLACTFMHGTSVYAQTPTEQAVQDNQNIIQRFEQDRLEKQLDNMIEREKKSFHNKAVIKDGERKQDGSCFDIDLVNIEGMKRFDTDDISDITGRFVGRCLYLSDINALAEAITNYYLERGYVTSRAYIPAQDLTGRILRLQVVEGRVDKIEMLDNGQAQDDRPLSHVFPSRTDDALNLRDIEQGVDNLNRLKSQNAKMELIPGSTPGASIIQVQNKRTKPWHVTTGIDNTGSAATGEWQGLFDVTYDNILGVQDILNASFKHDLERANRRQSRNVSLRYEVPYKYWNAYYSLSYFNYINEVVTPTNRFRASGISRVHDVGLSRVLHRGQISKTNAKVSLVSKENENFFSGVLLTNSSQKLTILNAELSQSWQIPRGFIYVGANYARGLGWLGAREDNGLSPEDPKAEFDKYTVDLSVVKLFNIGVEDYTPKVNIRARAQRSADTLFSSERISIGGPSSVRGFKSSSISGDSGAYLHTNISLPFSPRFAPEWEKDLGGVEVFAGFDIGAIKGDDKNSFEGGTVKSWSLGIKNKGALFNFDATISRGFSAPDYVDEKPYEFILKTALHW